MGAAVKKQTEETAPTADIAPRAPANDGLAIYRAMPAIMKAVGHIEKGRQNPQQGYKFRGIDEVYEAVQLVLANHGVFVVPYVVEQMREERQTQKGGVLIYTILKVDHTFFAEDGSSVVARTIGEAMDSGDKSSNKAMSAAMKYALIESLSIPTREAKDTENDSPEPAPRHAQHRETRAADPLPGERQQIAKSSHGHDRAEASGEINRPSEPAKWFTANPAKMRALQAAVGKLSLGMEEVKDKGLTGKVREDCLRGYRIQYLRWAAGRDTIHSTTDLTDDEASVVLDKAESGSVPL